MYSEEYRICKLPVCDIALDGGFCYMTQIRGQLLTINFFQFSEKWCGEKSRNPQNNWIWSTVDRKCHAWTTKQYQEGNWFHE